MNPVVIGLITVVVLILLAIFSEGMRGFLITLFFILLWLGIAGTLIRGIALGLEMAGAGQSGGYVLVVVCLILLIIVIVLPF